MNWPDAKLKIAAAETQEADKTGGRQDSRRFTEHEGSVRFI